MDENKKLTICIILLKSEYIKLYFNYFNIKSMILGKKSIIEEINKGNIIADGVLQKMINNQSIDCSLYNQAWILKNNEFELIDIRQGYNFVIGDFGLFAVDEWIGTKGNSGICCEFKLKSTSARQGIDHLFAGWIDTGYFSRLTLELSFKKNVTLKSNDLIGQFIFHRVEGETENYSENGNYQNSSSLEELKSNWNMEMLLPKPIKNKFSL